MHLHGGVTPADSDGHPEQMISPGQTVTHRFPQRQEAAHMWYHDHAMGFTRLNVYAGLAGMYFLRDEFDTGRIDNPLGLPAGNFELPLVLQEKIFESTGQQSVRSTAIVPEGSWEGGAVGDVGVVNGKIWPQMSVSRGLYRFRVINAGSYSVWNLHFSNGMQFFVIGNDGGLLDAPVAATHIRLAPAERYDILVDFAKLAEGESVELRNDEAPPFQAAVIGAVVHDAHAIAQQGAAARPRGGIDGDHADGLGVAPPGGDQGGTKRGLADARWAGDAHHMGARLAPRRIEQRLGRCAVGIALQSGKRCGQRPLALFAERRQGHSVLSAPPSAACAAASRAIGTR